MKFIRRVRLTVENDFRKRIFDSREFRITFRCRTAIDSKANEAEVTVWNLSGTTEDDLLERFTEVRLEAGYRDEPRLYQINQGQIMRSERGRDGPNRFFTLFFRNTMTTQAHVNVGIRGDIPVRDLVRELVDRMNEFAAPLSTPIVLIEHSLENIPEDARVSNFTYNGNAGDGLTKLLESVGIVERFNNRYRLTWTLGGNSLYITTISANDEEDIEATFPETFILSEQKGMIEVPERLENKQIKVRTLLTGEIQLDQWIMIEPPATSIGRIFYKDERYRVIDLLHEGDTWGGDFYTEIQAQ